LGHTLATLSSQPGDAMIRPFGGPIEMNVNGIRRSRLARQWRRASALRPPAILSGLAGVAMLTFTIAAQQPASVPPIHAKPVRRLVLKNAMVIYGNARPAAGPIDVAIEDGRISYVGPQYDLGAPGPSDAVID